MLERIASSLLSKYLGEYIEGLNAENLKFNLRAGNLVLKNLRLKKTAFKQLELLISFKDGYVETLIMQVPWSALNSKPVVIRICGVYVVLSPKSRDQSAEEFKHNTQLMKQQMLQIAHALGQDRFEKITEENKKNSGFFERMTATVADNIQIFVDKIHILYEDDISSPGEPFSFGITLDHFHVQSTDENMNPTFLNVGKDMIYKLVDLKDFGIYLNTTKNFNVSFVEYENIEELKDKLDAMIPVGDNPSMNHYYLLNPLSCNLKAIYNKKKDLSIPLFQVCAELSKAALGLSSSQYKRILNALNYFTYYVRFLEYMEFRPPPNTSPSTHPRLWWKYAIDSIKTPIEKKKTVYTWEHIEKFSEDRRTYIQLYKKKFLNTSKFTSYEDLELENLEKNLEYSNILMFRRLANDAIEREKAQQSHFGWLTSWLSFGQENIADDEEQAKKELHEIIGYSANQEESTLVYKNGNIKNKFEFTLQHISFSLLQQDISDQEKLSGGKSVTPPVLLSCLLRSFNVSVNTSDSNMSVTGNLKDISIAEYHSLNGKELLMLRSSTVRQNEEQNFVSFNFDQKFEDESTPPVIGIELMAKPLDIIFSRSLFDRTIEFFERDSSFDELNSASNYNWKELKKRTQHSFIEGTTEDRSRILNINLMLSAPRILVPINFVDPYCPAIAIDLGKININSVNTEVDESKNETGETEESEYEKAINRFCDRFRVSITDLNAMVLGGKNSKWSEVKEFDETYSIVDKFSINVEAKMRRSSYPSDFPKLSLYAALQRLNIRLLDWRVSWIYEIFLSATTQKNLNSKTGTGVTQRSNRTEFSKSYIPPLPQNESNAAQEYFSSHTPNVSSTSKAKKKRGTSDTNASDEAQNTTELVSFQFEIEDFNIELLKAARNTRFDDSNVKEYKDLELPSSAPLVTIQFKHLKMTWHQQNVRTYIVFLLSYFNVEDAIALSEENRPGYLARSGYDVPASELETKDATQYLIYLEYIITPRDSPAYENVDHYIKAKIGDVFLNINRVSIACLLQAVSDFLTYLNKKNSEDTRAQASEVTVKDTTSGYQKFSLAKASEHSTNRPGKCSIFVAHTDLGNVQMSLNQSNKPLMVFVLYSSYAMVDLREEGTMHIDGYLGGIDIQYMRSCLPKWSHVFYVDKGEKTLTFDIYKHDVNSPSYPGYDMSLKVELNSLRCLLFNSMYKVLTNYFGAFDIIKREVATATSFYYFQMLETAKNSSMKVKLSLSINNPTIILPRSNHHEEYLLMDFGKIIVKNSFEEEPVVLDVSEISVSGSKLTSYSYIEGKEVPQSIIEQDHLLIVTKRLLGDVKKLDVPAIYMELSVKNQIKMSLTEFQLQLGLQIVNDNLKETGDFSSQAEVEKIAYYLSGISFVPVETYLNAMQTGPGQDDDDNSKSLEMRMHFNQVSLILLRTLSLSEPSSQESSPLLRFSIVDADLVYCQFSNGRLTTEFWLKKVIMEDLRPNASKRFSLIWGPQDPESNGESDASAEFASESQKSVMFSANYTQEVKSNTTNICFKLSKPMLYLIPSAIKDIYEYSMGILCNTSKTLSTLRSEMMQAGEDSSQTKRPKEQALSADQKNQEQSTDMSAIMVFSITLESPELLFFIERHGEDKVNAFSLFIGESAFQYCSVPLKGSQSFQLEVRSLEMYRCVLAAGRHPYKSNYIRVLQPISAKMEMELLNGASAIRSNFRNVHAILTYSDISLLLNVYNEYRPLIDTFYALKGEQNAKTDQDVSRLAQGDSEVEENADSEGSYSFLDEDNLFKIRQNCKVVVSMASSVGLIQLDLVNDLLKYNALSPVLQLLLDSSQLSLTVFEDGTIMSSFISKAIVNSHNDSLNVYEPVLEPLEFDVQMLRNVDTASVSLKTNEILNLNVTKFFLNTLFELFNLYKNFRSMLENGPGSLVVEDEMDNIEIGASSSRDKKTKASSSIQKYEDSSNMVLSCQVSNQTGDDIECYLFKHVREKNMTKRLSPGESASMPILVGRNQLENLWTDCMMDLSFPCKPMYQEILNVPISKTSVMAYGLSRFDQSIVLLVQVSFDRGNKQVVLRGNWTFFNATCVPLEIMLDYAQICKNGQKVVKSIDPRTSYSIPLEFTEVQSVRMRPKAEEEFDWFEMERDSSKQGELLVDSVTAMSYVHTTNRQSRVWAVAVREKTSRVRNNQLSVVDRQVRFSPYLTIKNMLYSTLWMKMVHTMCENLEASPPISLPILEAKDLVWFSVPKKAKESTAGYLSTIGLSIRIEGYAWSKPVELFLGDTQKEKASKKKEIPIKLSKEGSKRRLSLLVDLNVFSEGGCGLYVYADYWLINQTGLDVRYAEKGEVDRGEVGAQESSGKRMSRDLESSALDSKSDQRGSYKKYLDYGYAYNVYYYDKKSLSIKVGNSKWSKLFPIGIKNEGIVYVRDSESENSELYQFSVLVHPGPGRFWRTKVVQLQPACILVNRASMPLRYRQDGCDESYALGCGEQIPFHWPRGQKDRKLVVCDLEEKYTWSAGLLLHIVGECQLKLRDLKDGSQTLCLNLVIKLVNAVTFVVFGDGDSDKCPFVVNSYQITNNSSCHVVFYQDGCKEREYSLPPQESMPYYWDIVQLQSPILVIRAEAGKNKRMKLSLDEIGAYPDIPLYQLQGKRALSFEVRLVGAKRELVISDFGPAEVERSTVKPKVTLMAKMEVRGIGVSIIDTKPQEILYLTMQFIFLEAQMSSLEQTLYMKVRSMQVDNQLYFSPFPIMLYAVPKSELPFFQLSVVQDVSVPNQWQFKYFGMQIQEIDINLHDVCIFQTLAFSNFAIDHLYRLTLLKEERNWLKNGASDQIPVITDEDLRSSDIFYFRILHLNPVKVNLSFMATSEGRSHSAALSTQENAPSFLESFMGYFGFLTSIDRAPVRLNALLLQNVSTSHTELLNRIMAHYKMSVIKQGYKILGSADFLGNPVSLVSNLGTGVRDFFYEPAMGIVESPSAFGRGLAKGTKSLLLKTLYVLFDTTSRLTNTVAEAGVKATFDSDYQRKRAFRNQMPITDARQGMMSGIHGLTSGFYKGFSGVIMDPIRGTKEEGAVGFLKGVQTGLTGVILKPTIGIVDLVSRTAQGIKNNAALANNRPYTPVRLPRYFGEDHILTVYDPEKSTGQLILCYIEGRQDRASVYIAHFMVKKNCLLVTKPYLYFLKSSRHSTGHFEWKVVWREELSDLYLCTVCPPTDYIGDKRLILEDEEWFLKLRFNPPHLRTLKSGKPHCSHVIKGPSASIRQISNTLSQQGAKSETKILSEYLRDASKKKNTDHTSKSALSSPTSSSPLLSGNYNSPDFFKNSNRENQRQSFSDASEQAADQCCCCSKCSVL